MVVEAVHRKYPLFAAVANPVTWKYKPAKALLSPPVIVPEYKVLPAEAVAAADRANTIGLSAER